MLRAAGRRPSSWYSGRCRSPPPCPRWRGSSTLSLRPHASECDQLRLNATECDQGLAPLECPDLCPAHGLRGSRGPGAQGPHRVEVAGSNPVWPTNRLLPQGALPSLKSGPTADVQAPGVAVAGSRLVTCTQSARRWRLILAHCRSASCRNRSAPSLGASLAAGCAQSRLEAPRKDHLSPGIDGRDVVKGPAMIPAGRRPRKWAAFTGGSLPRAAERANTAPDRVVVVPFERRCFPRRRATPRRFVVEAADEERPGERVAGPRRTLASSRRAGEVARRLVEARWSRASPETDVVVAGRKGRREAWRLAYDSRLPCGGRGDRAVEMSWRDGEPRSLSAFDGVLSLRFAERALEAEPGLPGALPSLF